MHVRTIMSSLRREYHSSGTMSRIRAGAVKMLGSNKAIMRLERKH